jgi:hypothetical protein
LPWALKKLSNLVDRLDGIIAEDLLDCESIKGIDEKSEFLILAPRVELRFGDFRKLSQTGVKYDLFFFLEFTIVYARSSSLNDNVLLQYLRPFSVRVIKLGLGGLV